MLKFLVLSFYLNSYSYQFWCLITVYLPWQALFWQFLSPEIIVTPLAKSCLLTCLDFHSEALSIPSLCPLQPHSWQNEHRPAKGRQKHRLYFQMLPLLPRWQMEQAGLACQTWHNSTLSSSKILAMLKPVACCPSPSAEPSFWHCSGDEEAQDGWIKWGGHWAKEAEEPPCTWVRRGSEGSQEATGHWSPLMWYIKMNDTHNTTEIIYWPECAKQHGDHSIFLDYLTQFILRPNLSPVTFHHCALWSSLPHHPSYYVSSSFVLSYLKFRG